jgi:hypothetical protein
MASIARNLLWSPVLILGTLVVVSFYIPNFPVPTLVLLAMFLGADFNYLALSEIQSRKWQRLPFKFGYVVSLALTNSGGLFFVAGFLVGEVLVWNVFFIVFVSGLLLYVARGILAYRSASHATIGGIT